MAPCPNERVLAQYLNGTTEPGQLNAIEAHVDGCPLCQQRLDRLTRDEFAGALNLTRLVRPRFEPGLSESERVLVERLARRPPVPPEPPPVPDGGPGVPSIPGYEILGELGRGGTAVVYRARHLALDRVVALKTLLVGLRNDEHSSGRLQQEARTLARLRHPNIVQVYEIGDHDGLPYFSLELVTGTSLALWANGRPQSPRAAAELVRVAAIAVDHAHRNGVLHRDLKPGNILIGAAPGSPERAELGTGPSAFTALVKVSDFGLAKVLDELGTRTEPRTEPGAVVGTPQYMAPEQARLGTDAIGPAADVYALGAVLYELLTGRPPFPSEPPLRTLYRVVHDEPPPVRRITPRVPADLETICAKCMEKDPRQRYPTADAVAAELSRFLASEPILARPVGAAGRFVRWVRRKPALAALLFVACGVTATAFAVVLALWQLAEGARDRSEYLADSESRARAEARVQEGRAVAARHRAELVLTELLLDRGLEACERGDIDQGLGWLCGALRTADAAGLADWDRASRYNLAMWARRRAALSTSPPLGSSALAVAFSPDGKRVLTGQWPNSGNQRGPGLARVWALDGWTPVGRPMPHDDAVIAVAFDADGAHILTGAADGTVRVWGAETNEPCGPPIRTPGGAVAIAFCLRGETVATLGRALAGAGSEVRVWNTGTGQPAGPVIRLRGPGEAIACTPDGRVVITSNRAPRAAEEAEWSEVRQWEIATGKPVGVRFVHSGAVRALACSPRGELVVSGGDDKVALVWDRATGKRVGGPVVHPYPIRSAAFAPNGRAVFTGVGDLPITPTDPARGGGQLWDVRTGELLVPPFENWSAVHGTAFDGPRGDLLATADRGGRIRVFRPGTMGPSAEVAPPLKAAGLVLAPDGSRAVVFGSGSASGGASWVVDSGTGKSASGPRQWPAPIERAAVAPDGHVYAIADAAGRVRTLEFRTDDRAGADLDMGGAVSELSFSSGGHRILAVGVGTGAKVWAWRTGELVWTCPVPALAVAALGPDGNTVVTGHGDGSIRFWDLRSGREWAAETGRKYKILSVAFHPDGKFVVAGDLGRAARRFDVASGRQIGPLLQHENNDLVWRVGFIGTGSNVFTVAGNTYRTNCSVSLWNVETGRPLRQLPHYVNEPAVSLDPGRRLLITGGWTEDVRLWDMPTGRAIGPPLSQAGKCLSAALSSDGRIVATLTQSGLVRVWALPSPAQGSPDDVSQGIRDLIGRGL